jgi:hypothetical protein
MAEQDVAGVVTSVVVLQDMPTAAEMQAEYRHHPERFTAPGPTYPGIRWSKTSTAPGPAYLNVVVLRAAPQYRRAPRPVRRVARRVVGRASCRARSPGRKPSDPEPPPLTAARRGERR